MLGYFSNSAPSLLLPSLLLVSICYKNLPSTNIVCISIESGSGQKR
jgi:hypothetical protein